MYLRDATVVKQLNIDTFSIINIKSCNKLNFIGKLYKASGCQ